MFKFNEMLKTALAMKSKMDKVKKELKKVRVEASSGGGLVDVVMDGEQNILKLNLDKELLSSGDKKLIEDLVVSAVNDAKQKSTAMAQEEMKKIMGDLPISPDDVGSLLPS
jgi:DNA-binding YbaB/EbfC family protein